VADPVVALTEIACDESGYEGERHAGAVTDVFAHASVAVPVDVAAECLRLTRARIGSPATEYKANHLLRLRSRPVLEWFLGADGPMLGHAHVYLVDKPYLLLTRLTGALLPDEPDAARVLRELPADPGWVAFLDAANDLLRVRPRTDDPVSSFYRAVDGFDPATTTGPAHPVLRQLAGTRPRALRYRAELQAEPPLLPALDPLFPALVRAAEHWRRPGTALRIVHDRQKTLTDERIDGLCRQLGDAGPVELTLADWPQDPRVQVADFVAGIAQRLATEALHGRGNAALLSLLRPYLDPCSVWVDAVSSAALFPARRLT
jgi:hypothetical protein